MTYEQVSKFEEQYICMNRSTFKDVCINRPYFSTSIYMNRLGFENTAGSSVPIWFPSYPPPHPPAPYEDKMLSLDNLLTHVQSVFFSVSVRVYIRYARIKCRAVFLHARAYQWHSRCSFCTHLVFGPCLLIRYVVGNSYSYFPAKTYVVSIQNKDITKQVHAWIEKVLSEGGQL